ncbi:MAG: aminoglycoside phosphotransferase family protein [Pseudanabaenaceae cyanobacterium bins.39]|nr:aminoglycoside phosphotransferase family protein [Pseudanabaenaceae cyanobacterium bins.39]
MNPDYSHPVEISPDSLIDQQLLAIATNFVSASLIKSIQPFGSGNVNHTFLIELNAPWRNAHHATEHQQLILQRINTHVFADPSLIMQNLRIYSDHLHQKSSLHSQRRWETPQIITTHSGADYLQIDADDHSGYQFWRSLSYILNSQSHNVLTSTDQAAEVGYALGRFHALTRDLNPHLLADTLIGFHITPLYWQQYQKAIAQFPPLNPTLEIRHCLNFIDKHKPLISILEDAKQSGKLTTQTMHGDPKINNILFDQTTQLAISLVDLDTVKPGLIHYDIGDCLRSACNLSGEETQDWEAVEFNDDLCQAVLRGYNAEMEPFLTDSDRQYIYDSIRVITFELGLRFFTDYLLGNPYFQAQYPEHNLWRSLVQFQLLNSLESCRFTLF